jgi:hypothetical protein
MSRSSEESITGTDTEAHPDSRPSERRSDESAPDSRPGEPSTGGTQTGPIRSADQDAPEQERLTTPAEERGQSIEQIDNPPQAEGQR